MGRAGAGAARRPTLLRRLSGPVRVRTAVAATIVVAVALIAAGATVILVLRDNLVDRAELEAELTARRVAGQVALGTDWDQLNLPDGDEQLVQVVAADHTVLASGEELESRGAVADFAAVAPATPVSGRTDPGDSEDEEDEDSGDDNADRPLAPGEVRSAATHATLRVASDREEGEGPAHTEPYRFAALQATSPRGQGVTVYAGASLETRLEAVSDTTRAMLGGLPVVLVVVAGMTWLVTHWALRPVAAIRAELAEITAGDLSRRVPVPPCRDEVAQLADTTNTTLAALESAVERQRRFVADASHELRSPIASLRTQLEVAAAHPGLLEIEDLLEDVVRLQRVAADLLLLARLDAGEQPRRERVDLAAVVREEAAHRREGRVPVEVATADVPGADSLMVRGSRVQLARMVANLLDNAQRHAAASVRAEVRRQNDTGAVVLEVTDDGPGIPAPDRERIFDRFIRLDDARSRDDGGAGLGLAIVRDVVHRHGGNIAVDDASGGGARFTVRLAAGDK